MKRRVISFITVFILLLQLCPAWALAAEEFTETVTLSKDMKWEESNPYTTVSGPTKMNTYQYTLTATKSTAIQVTETGILTLTGTVVSEKGAGVEVQPKGILITEEPVSISGTTYALDIAAGAEVQLAPGTYTGGTAAIHAAEGATVKPAEGYTFTDGDGNPISPDNLGSTTTITVKQCVSHVKGNCTAVSGSPTHTWTCPNCGTSGTEPCTFTFDGNGTGTCGQCKRGLKVEVNLSGLIYDGTVQPEQVTVTATLTDSPSKVLMEDTDYKVEVVSIKDAGQATVTVTGLTFNGTFVKTYTVEPDTPGLSWDTSTTSAPVTVDYDGQPVETSDLPPVKINIQSTVDHLEGYLQYSYRKQGDTDYINGLPKDAGTYDVIASLPKMTNFEGAVSNPITLTINKIDPIKAAPAATKPTYNHSSQALVTAGALNSVAVADGLKIQFATNVNGPYIETIPTETDAGGYTVWYKVTGLTDNYIAPTTNPASVSVTIAPKAITPRVELSESSYTYDGAQKSPKITLWDGEAMIPVDQYTVTWAGTKGQGEPDLLRVADTYKATITSVASGNYTFTANAEVEIIEADQETITITGNPAQVYYGDVIQLGVVGGTGSGTVKWSITGKTDSFLTQGGLLTVKDVGAAIKVTVTRTRDNYEDVSDTWEFTPAKKAVTAEVSVAAKSWDGNIDVPSGNITAVVKTADLAFSDDSITITGLTGTYDNSDVGTNKTVTLTGWTVGGTSAGKYDVTIPATTTASILAVPATVDTVPVANTFTYDASQAQALVTAGTATGGAMVYSLDGTNFTLAIPKAKDAGTYTVYYKAQGDRNHTDSETGTVTATIKQQTVTPQIELSPSSAQYDGQVHQPAVTVRDGANNVIPASEYKVTYVTDNSENWTDQGTYTVKVENIAGGNYAVQTSTADFRINKAGSYVISAPVGRTGLKYTGVAQELLAQKATASGGVVVYSVDGKDGTYSADLPTGTAAGTYTVYYKVQGDANHTDSNADSVKVTIASKAVSTPTVELSDNTVVYKGAAQEPTVTVKDGNTVIPNDQYTVVYDNNVNVGTATVTVTAKTGGNYVFENGPVTKNFEITQASLTVTAKDQAITYGDSIATDVAQATATGLAAGDTLESVTLTANTSNVTNAGSITPSGAVIQNSSSANVSANYIITYTAGTLTIRSKALTVSSATVTPRAYNGTNTVEVTGVTLDGKLTDDDVSVDTSGLTGTISGTDAGTYNTVTLSGLTLTGTSKDNYTIRPTVSTGANVTISQAGSLTPKTGSMEIASTSAGTYTFGLDALLPNNVPADQRLGTVKYTSAAVNLTDPYTGNATISDQTLTLTIDAVSGTAANNIGTITVTIETGNFQDMTAIINVSSVDKTIPTIVTDSLTLSPATITYGQPLSTIKLSGNMKDGTTDVPGTFAWANPNYRPGAQDAYQAAWVFTPDERDKYATVNGTSTITVNPAPITSAVVTLDQTSFRCDGQSHSPAVTAVTLEGITLTGGRDYTVQIPSETNAGTYTVIVTGQGNYTGTVMASFTIANEPTLRTVVTSDGKAQVQWSIPPDTYSGRGQVMVSSYDASGKFLGTSMTEIPDLSQGASGTSQVDAQPGGNCKLVLLDADGYNPLMPALEQGDTPATEEPVMEATPAADGKAEVQWSIPPDTYSGKGQVTVASYDASGKFLGTSVTQIPDLSQGASGTAQVNAEAGGQCKLLLTGGDEYTPLMPALEQSAP